VWTYDRHRTPTPRQLSVETIGAESYLYAPGRSAPDPKSDAFERWLATEIDAPASAALRKLREGGITEIDTAERSLIAAYVASQELRTPWMQRHILGYFQAGVDAHSQDTAYLEQLRLGMKEETGVEATTEEIRCYVDALDIKLTNAVWLDFIRDNVNVAGERLFRQSWSVLESPPIEPFLTNDLGITKFLSTFERPMPYTPGWGGGCDLWAMPLSSRSVLLLHPGVVGEMGQATPTFAAALNAQAVRDAVRFVYAASVTPSVLPIWRDGNGGSRPGTPT
jgi:hypothetical protein